MGLLLTQCNPSSPKMTDFPLQDYEGKPVAIADFQNQKVFVHFWATWCRDCLVELPSLIQAANDLKAQNQKIVFLMISDEEPERVTAFLEGKNIPFTFVRMTKPIQSVGIHSIPQTYIVNEKGEILLAKGQHEWTAKNIVNAFSTSH